MPAPVRTPSTPGRPAPLLAAAAALVGVAAARTPLGKLALLAAAGTAAYRLLRRPPVRQQAPQPAQADWCRIRPPVAEKAAPPAVTREAQSQLAAAPPTQVQPHIAPPYPSNEVSPITGERPIAVLAEEPTSGPAASEAPPPASQPEQPQVAARAETEQPPASQPLQLPTEESAPSSASPLWMADPLPHLPEVHLPANAHPLTTAAENPWLLSVEPLPVLANEEPSRLNDALLESGVLDATAEIPSTSPSQPTEAYVPPLALGGDIPDMVSFEPDPPAAVEEPTSAPLAFPLTSEKMAELLKALAPEVAFSDETPADTALESAPVPNPPTALESEPEVSAAPQAEPEAPRPFTVLPEARVAPAPVAPPANPPTAPPSVPLVSAAELFASLAKTQQADAAPASDAEPAQEEALAPKSPVTTSLKPKIRPRPIVTVAHPNHPGRKNWLTWWK